MLQRTWGHGEPGTWGPGSQPETRRMDRRRMMPADAEGPKQPPVPDYVSTRQIDRDVGSCSPTGETHELTRSTAELREQDAEGGNQHSRDENSRSVHWLGS